MKTTSREEFEKQNMFGMGNANTAFAQYFIGDSFLNPLTKPEDGLFLANVTFEPGCRNNWHIHHAKSGADSSLSALLVKAGIRKKEKRRSALCREALS